jgi:hypothetical protein
MLAKPAGMASIRSGPPPGARNGARHDVVYAGSLLLPPRQGGDMGAAPVLARQLCSV